MRIKRRVSPGFARVTMMVSLILAVLLVMTGISYARARTQAHGHTPTDKPSAVAQGVAAGSATAGSAAVGSATTLAPTSSNGSAAPNDTSSHETSAGKDNDKESSDKKDAADKERQAYIDEWTSRIDAYLSGSALDGYGATFARAAYDYGVDPRLPPAIACVESGKGAHCYYAYNAWGWGQSSWSSWEESIPAYVENLGSAYGGQFSYDMAASYCPANVDEWYYLVEAEMEKI